MAVKDLTGQQIQHTYHRVIQTDGTLIADGTGSILPIKFDGPDLIVSGALRAQSYIVSESIINVSSGSTYFGDSSDDSHTFVGIISSSSDISSSGDLYAKYLTLSTPGIDIDGSSNGMAVGSSFRVGATLEIEGSINVSGDIMGDTIIATNGFGIINGGTF